jgi:glycerophosphoryl diester phosphodiesterase
VSRKVWPQSFDMRDVLYWFAKEPAFGKQAVYLDDAETTRRSSNLQFPFIQSPGSRVSAHGVTVL